VDRALRTLGWDLLFGSRYYRALARHVAFPLREDGLDLRHATLEDAPFPAGTFDLIVSFEVFEHLVDVPRVLASLHRLLTPSGLLYVYVHNYTSVSGGHHLAWKYPDTEPSDIVPPWDHLRANRFPDIPSWINRLRERDYRSAFGSHFEVLEWADGAREGEALLTVDLRAELAAYTERELLLKGFVVVARPRQPTSSPRPPTPPPITGNPARIQLAHPLDLKRDRGTP
jgi:SAM-dependent methyltransferase